MSLQTELQAILEIQNKNYPEIEKQQQSIIQQLNVSNDCSNNNYEIKVGSKICLTEIKF